MATTETLYSSPAVGAVVGTIVGVLVGVVISNIIMIVMCVIFVRRRPKRIHGQGGAIGNAVYDGGSCMGYCCFVRTGELSRAIKLHDSLICLRIGPHAYTYIQYLSLTEGKEGAPCPYCLSIYGASP